MEAYYSIKFQGNTGEYYSDPHVILKAPTQTECVRVDADAIIILEPGYYAVYISFTCDTTKVGTRLYSGIILTINGSSYEDCEALLPDGKYSMIVAQQIFNFNTSDVLKIKNEGVSYGAVNGHLYFQIRKLYF